MLTSQVNGCQVSTASSRLSASLKFVLWWFVINSCPWLPIVVLVPYRIWNFLRANGVTVGNRGQTQFLRVNELIFPNRFFFLLRRQ